MAEKPVSILLLAESEKSAVLDRRALRDAGYPAVRLLSSGIEAARLLADASCNWSSLPSVVICQGQLEDMDGEQFCAIVRQHPALSDLPILLIMPNEQEAQQLVALGCQASAIISRPYSLDTLRTNISSLSAETPAQGAHPNPDTRSFDEAIATYGVLLKSGREPEDFFKAGMRCLAEERWATAISAFERAMREERIRGEAELGLAAAYKGKGDTARFRFFLGEASEAFLAAKRWNRARNAYARLLQHEPSARNPFLAEAHRLVHQHDYNGAAEVLVQGLSVIAKRKIGERLARVCLAAEEPEKMFAVLEKSMKAENIEPFTSLLRDIRESLNLMEEQKRERQKAQAVERKWELSRSLKLAAKKEKADAATFSAGAPSGAGAKPEKKAKPLSRLDRPEPLSEKTVAGLGEEDVDYLAEGREVLQPLKPHVEKQGLSEMLSVIKLTWNLSRKANKKR